MRSIKLVVAVIILVLGAGCAATGPKFSDISASIPSLPGDKGRIYFYRPDTMLGGAVTSDIRLNGKVVGRSVRGSFFFVDEAPGNMTVLTSTEVEKQLTFKLVAGETKYVRTSVSMGVLVGRINSELANSAEAKAEISGLSYIGTPMGK